MPLWRAACVQTQTSFPQPSLVVPGVLEGSQVLSPERVKEHQSIFETVIQVHSLAVVCGLANPQSRVYKYSIGNLCDPELISNSFDLPPFPYKKMFLFSRIPCQGHFLWVNENLC